MKVINLCHILNFAKVSYFLFTYKKYIEIIFKNKNIVYIFISFNHDYVMKTKLK